MHLEGEKAPASAEVLKPFYGGRGPQGATLLRLGKSRPGLLSVLYNLPQNYPGD